MKKMLLLCLTLSTFVNLSSDTNTLIYLEPLKSAALKKEQLIYGGLALKHYSMAKFGLAQLEKGIDAAINTPDEKVPKCNFSTLELREMAKDALKSVGIKKDIPVIFFAPAPVGTTPAMVFAYKDTNAILINTNSINAHQLTKDEVKAFLVHEAIHVKNNDSKAKTTLFKTLYPALVISQGLATNLILDEELSNTNIAIKIASTFLAGVITSYVFYLKARNVEINADIESCKATGDFQSLISGLKKVQEHTDKIVESLPEPLKSITKAQLALDPHPSTEERVRYLTELEASLAVN